MTNTLTLRALLMSLLFFLLLTPAATAQALKGKITENTSVSKDSVYPADLLYAKSHEYVRLLGERHVVIGITRFFTDQLGGVTVLGLVQPGQILKKDARFAIVESERCIADIFMPVSGKVVAINNIAREEPGLVHSSCYYKGWLITVELTNPEELKELLSSLQYKCFIAQ